MKNAIDGVPVFRAVCMSLPLVVSLPALGQSTRSDAASGTPTTVTGGLYVSPKNGQSADQQSSDRYACYSWAVKETNFDPSTSSGGSSAGMQNFRRAMSACLEGRGYAVSAASSPSASSASSSAPTATASAPAVMYRQVSSSAPELGYHAFEFQFGGGYTPTVGVTDQNLRGGPNAGLGIAWFPTSALPLGLRVDGNWSRLTPKNDMLNAGGGNYTSGRENIYGGDADLQLDLAHHSTRSKLYLLGGMGWYRIETQLRQFQYQPGTICGWYYCANGYVPQVVAENNTTSTWQKAWNAGLGWEVAIAPSASFFVEARYRHFLPNRNGLNMVPITVGFRF